MLLRAKIFIKFQENIVAKFIIKIIIKFSQSANFENYFKLKYTNKLNVPPF